MSMEPSLAGKNILVVGGGAGIGLATAELCLQKGANVFIGDLQAPVDAPPGLKFCPVNVTDEASVKALFTSISQETNCLDGLIQTAGILKGAYIPLSELPVETFRQVLDVNVVGSYLCAQYAEPFLKMSKSAVIILISSGAATGGSSSLAYGTSKGAINAFAITLTNRMAEHNIRVNVVAPGNIDTGMKRSVIAAEAETRGTPDQYEDLVAKSGLGKPEGVARVLAWLVSDDASYVRGLITTR